MRERTGIDVFDVYDKVKGIGEGSMGSVHMVRRKPLDSSKAGGSFSTSDAKMPLSDDDKQSAVRRRSSKSALYALKSIQLARMSDEFIAELKNEIDILKSLDHPNIVKPLEVFNRKRQMFIIMELCSGGDLYTRDPYTEDEAGYIVGQLLSAISYMHSRNITHRDLKFENIMFESNSATASIKVIDFGLSKKYVPESPHLVEGVGTIYTMAPQVLQGMYTSQADLWSVGVISYMLLCGDMPFSGKKRRHVIDKIMRCSYGFSSPRWGQCSNESKDFVKGLIQMDPKKRWDADQALASGWMAKKFDIINRAPSEQVMTSAATSLKSYGQHAQLAKMALMVIAHQATSEDVMELRKVFDAYDTANNGTIQYKEFQAALEKCGYDDEQVKEIFTSVDVDQSGIIHYTEFLAAAMEAHGHVEEEQLMEAFDRLDADDSGYITMDNLRQIMGSAYTKEKANAFIKEADLDGNGKICWDEFKGMFERKREGDQKALQALLPHMESTSSMADDGNLVGIDAKIPI
jgi:serine/threonine protein kinase